MRTTLALLLAVLVAVAALGCVCTCVESHPVPKGVDAGDEDGGN